MTLFTRPAVTTHHTYDQTRQQIRITRKLNTYICLI